jgi:molybdopterin/thiamine biosynthesis adenylyltransferase
MMWAIEDLARFVHERDAIASVSSSVDWLTAVRWYLSDARDVCVDADLQVGSVTRKITLRYPEMFPHAPPTVTPRESEERWSSHQYGSSGELCLAFRPDNWVSTVTGADMLASAYDLLATESGVAVDNAAPRTVPSAHRTSLGQAIRGESWRFLLTASTEAALRQLKAADVGTIKFCSTAGTVVGWLKTVGAEPVRVIEADFPAEIRSSWPETRATIVPILGAGPVLTTEVGKDASALRAALVGTQQDVGDAKDELLLLVTPTNVRAIYLWVENSKNTAFEISVIPIAESRPRQGGEAARLADHRIAIVGCGSLGSKVASTLARAGIKDFVLVDDDVFLPENIVRHELDWEFIGLHKVDALACRLKLLGARDVSVRRQQLGGQESGRSLANVMRQLKECTLIVDASANDLAFSYVSAVAERFDKPVVWGKIFGGGFGGEIGRVRPGIEPTAEVARHIIAKWCDSQDSAPPASVSERYESGEADAPMIAYDADISVIAAQVARMTIDTLLQRTPSAFESSAYLIGLRKEWIFTAAFDTWPIDLGGPVQSEERTSLSDDQIKAAAGDLLKIVKQVQ